MALILVQPPPPTALPGADFAWAEWSADRQRLRQQGSAPPALLPGQGEATVIVPAAALSWHRVTLPPGSLASAARLRSVLAGLLEDRLLDEPEQLHFALEPGARAGLLAFAPVIQANEIRQITLCYP